MRAKHVDTRATMNTDDPIPSAPLTVSIVQNSAGRDIARNLADVERLLSDSPKADLIALPEVFALRGSDDDYRAVAETVQNQDPGRNEFRAADRIGPVIQRLADLAARRRSWILAGSVIEKAGRSIFNTSVMINREGRPVAAYRKIHLFEARLDSGQVIREQDMYSAGDVPVMITVDGWRCGMAICYDLRFPELFRHYADKGAHVFFVPSNFTQNTGTDHWETLLRARAIENQAFVIAPDQCGSNPCTGIASYGHSLAAGPWGDILCKAENRECVLTVTLDPADLARTRNRIPVLRHRRLTAYMSDSGQKSRL